MINKRVNGLTVFLLLVSVIAPVFFATRSLAEATDTPIELISFKLIEHQDQQLTAELSLSVPESQDEQQITLDISDNYLIDSENLPVIDQETKETIGNCTYQNRQINLDFNPMTKDTTVEIQLKGDYLSDENDLYVEHSATNQRLIIQQDQLQQSDSKINDSSDSVKKRQTFKAWNQVPPFFL